MNMILEILDNFCTVESVDISVYKLYSMLCQNTITPYAISTVYMNIIRQSEIITHLIPSNKLLCGIDWEILNMFLGQIGKYFDLQSYQTNIMNMIFTISPLSLATMSIVKIIMFITIIKNIQKHS